jgi:hypothetical protein
MNATLLDETLTINQCGSSVHAMLVSDERGIHTYSTLVDGQCFIQPGYVAVPREPVPRQQLTEPDSQPAIVFEGQQTIPYL